MEYEKKNKDAISTIKQKLRQLSTNGVPVGNIIKAIKDMEDIFPELKESKDESMVKFIKNQLFNIKKTITENYELYAKLTKAIFWLEKQCEQKMKTTEESLGIDSDTYNKIVDECIYGEQKPTDNVEPEFHEGEWIIHQGTENIYQVVARIDNQYQLKYGDNYTIQKCADVDRCARLWDITKDANDGDVLAWDDSKCIALFKNIYDEDSFNSYGFVGCCTGTFESRQSYHDIEGSHPATKEQYDLLFQKMHEAGYEWDAEKKSIVDLKKKVELKPFDKVVVRCSEADRWSIDFFSYKAPNGYICTGDAWFGYCLPYNEETAKLIGTTINMEV